MPGPDDDSAPPVSPLRPSDHSPLDKEQPAGVLLEQLPLARISPEAGLQDKIPCNGNKQTDGDDKGRAAAEGNDRDGSNDGYPEDEFGDINPAAAGGDNPAGKGTQGEEQGALAQDVVQVTVSP